MDARFLAFFLVSLALIMTPGPDMALTTRNSLRGGWRAVPPTAWGVAVGLAVWGTASALGVAALLAASAAAFTAVKLAGALYLAWLGAHSLLSAVRPNRDNPAHRHDSAPRPAPGPPARRSRGPWVRREFAEGLLNNLLNPKAAVIFLSVFPQFVRPGDPPARLAVMVAVFSLTTLGWLHVYGGSVARAGRYVGPRVRRILDAITGAVMLALGGRLAFEQR